MTDEEKEANPTYQTTGGYLKVYDYQEAFQNSYQNASREEQLKVKNLPNFDADVFYQISGIRIDDDLMTGKEVEVIIDGRVYKAVIK